MQSAALPLALPSAASAGDHVQFAMRVEFLRNSGAWCTPAPIHSTSAHPRAAPPPPLARQRASQPMQANARRRGRPPFAVNTSERGEAAVNHTRLPGCFGVRRTEIRGHPLPSSRFCAPVPRVSCDSVAEGLPVCHQEHVHCRFRDAILRRRLPCLEDRQRTCKG
jgi:hypothetical protein